jgi:hypothetical protein
MMMREKNSLMMRSSVQLLVRDRSVVQQSVALTNILASQVSKPERAVGRIENIPIVFGVEGIALCWRDQV